jgi:drug/metabolite transporter (DMT)-like permease
VPIVVLPIIGLAAVLHAAWNVILKTSADPVLVAFRLNLVSVVLAAPVVAAWWLASGSPAIPPEAWLLGLVSGALEAAYFVSLSTAYRHGDLSVVYPIARGTAPLLAVVVGVVLFGERLAPVGWLGVSCLLAGMLIVARPWRALRAREPTAGGGARGWLGWRLDPAVGFALLTGALIASYSAVDRAGVRIVAPFVYGFILFGVATVCLWAWITIGSRLGRRAVDSEGAQWGRSAVAGVIAFTAYVLVLVALSIAPLVVVAPLRESAIVLVSGWGAIRLAEASGRGDALRRVGAAVLVVGGMVLLVVGA